MSISLLMLWQRNLVTRFALAEHLVDDRHPLADRDTLRAFFRTLSALDALGGLSFLSMKISLKQEFHNDDGHPFGRGILQPPGASLVIAVHKIVLDLAHRPLVVGVDDLLKSSTFKLAVLHARFLSMVLLACPYTKPQTRY